MWETQKEVLRRKLRIVGKAFSKYSELSTANESARILVLLHIFLQDLLSIFLQSAVLPSLFALLGASALAEAVQIEFFALQFHFFALQF